MVSGISIFIGCVCKRKFKFAKISAIERAASAKRVTALSSCVDMERHSLVIVSPACGSSARCSIAAGDSASSGDTVGRAVGIGGRKERSNCGGTAAPN